MEPRLVTRVFVGTWLGRAGTSVEFARTENALRTAGERVVTLRWTDTGTVHVRHMTGDGRRTDAVSHEEATLPATTTDDEVRAWAEARLT